MIFLILIFLFWDFEDNLVHGIYESKISYEDLKALNASCYPKDSCMVERSRDSPGIPWSYSCSCDRLCFQLGTCCIDSPHRTFSSPTVKPVCRTVTETYSTSGYYMVDRCSNDGGVDSVWRNLCEDEWNGEDDIMKVAPVTSLFTAITYKNYYCLKCHETTDYFINWNLFLESDYNYDLRVESKDVSVTYNRDYWTWMAIISGKEDFSLPVKLMFLFPYEGFVSPISCDLEIISRCANSWRYRNTIEKCNAYTGLIFIRRDGIVLKYKNAHCALCNYESLNNMICEHTGSVGFGGKLPFSFTHLLDINRSDGDKVGKSKKCDENYLWDPYGKRCRKTGCAIKGYVIKNGKCAPP